MKHADSSFGIQLHQMQVGLAVVRGLRNDAILSNGKFPKHIKPRTLQAFNLATVCGARAIGMEEKIGSLKEGKQADVVVFDASSPAMVCAADIDPLVAVVRHASPKDVEMVFVGGEVLKEEGRLLDVERVDAIQGEDSQLKVEMKGERLSWRQVSDQLRRSREEIQRRIGQCNIGPARQAVLKMWGVADPEKIMV